MHALIVCFQSCTCGLPDACTPIMHVSVMDAALLPSAGVPKLCKDVRCLLLC